MSAWESTRTPSLRKSASCSIIALRNNSESPILSSSATVHSPSVDWSLLKEPHGGRLRQRPLPFTHSRGHYLKWSFVGLMVTALFQLVVVLMSGSVALLSDTIHNFGDAATAVPLGIAFALTRLGVSRLFTFGYGRVEDLAGVLIVLIILFSAVVAGYQAVERLIHPQPIGMLWAVGVASVIGFLGNEAVAVFRIRVGREIGSAAL